MVDLSFFVCLFLRNCTMISTVALPVCTSISRNSTPLSLQPTAVLGHINLVHSDGVKKKYRSSLSLHPIIVDMNIFLIR